MTNSALIWAFFQVVVCVGVISVVLSCWCHKTFCRRNGVNVVYVPAPAPPAGYQPPFPNYHHAPPPNSGLPPNSGPPPVPSAPPPSYQEATSPTLFPLDVSRGPLMFSPQYSVLHQNSQPPFNPQYCLPKYNST